MGMVAIFEVAKIRVVAKICSQMMKAESDVDQASVAISFGNGNKQSESLYENQSTLIEEGRYV